jgi:hypothetical protein
MVKKEQDEIGGTRSAHGGDYKCTQNFGQKKGTDHLIEIGVGGRIILRCVH